MYVESSYTVSTCANIGGFFTVHNTQGESGRFCYYLQFNCTYYSINNQCYRFKTVTNDKTECSSNGGYYQHGYCYNHCPTSKYLINETCYDFRSAYTPQKCKENRGYFNEKENYCYYSENCVSGYTINQTLPIRWLRLYSCHVHKHRRTFYHIQQPRAIRPILLLHTVQL